MNLGLRGWWKQLWDSSDAPAPRPVLDRHFESNVKGLYVIGDLAGAPVVKLAMEQGDQVAAHIVSQPDARARTPGVYDVIVAGAGAAGLNAALTLHNAGLRVLVLEKNEVASTIEDFPEGKWVYAEPAERPARGKLWLEGARKEDLLARWHEIIRENRLDVRVREGVTAIERGGVQGFRVRTPRGEYRARRVILATGQRGNPRRLGVPGEDRSNVHHRLYSPREYRGEEILVVGGGNSAAEAALALAEHNRVTLSYRGAAFHRLLPELARKLEQAVSEGRIRVLYRSRVREFGAVSCRLEVEHGDRVETLEVPYDRAFVLIGAEPPARFLRSLGLRLETDWTGSPALTLALVAVTFLGLWILGSRTGIPMLAGLGWLGGAAALAAVAALVRSGLRGSRFSWLGVSFVVAYTVYGVKLGEGHELWPFRDWGYRALSFLDRPWAFWYTVLYTAVMTVFGLQAMKRWGLDRKDKFQTWRYVSLLAFQWTFFFLIPEFLFRWAVEYEWVGARLANDPKFAGEAWRAYGLVYAWPLFFYTFFGAPHQIWVVWGVLLSFVVLPVLALFHGKRYCSWICGCGGLAETLGDRWRHLAPKGRTSIRLEAMNKAVLWAAAAITLAMVLRDSIGWLRAPAEFGVSAYRWIADLWLVGILPVTLYPFFGGRIWCRYWCPLAKLIEYWSALYTRLRISRFAIQANEKCIACGECTRYCQVGIDVMRFALKQEELNNLNSSCIGCGICVTVCPMGVLSFGSVKPATPLVQIAPAGAGVSTR
ncbi:MAG: NAD(P)-binding domain-containing protein [Bryobacterales bacterium]|nr:NAD(P)-binding domain-containing protein [Bryobacteraceae bacterium]MDW8355294.1 NAD(P)-binding domain-containing protein [Bryobacterales bacterium]